MKLMATMTQYVVQQRSKPAKSNALACEARTTQHQHWKNIGFRPFWLKGPLGPYTALNATCYIFQSEKHILLYKVANKKKMEGKSEGVGKF